jgi:hypothetical protein
LLFSKQRRKESKEIPKTILKARHQQQKLPLGAKSTFIRQQILTHLALITWQISHNSAGSDYVIEIARGRV